MSSYSNNSDQRVFTLQQDIRRFIVTDVRKGKGTSRKRPPLNETYLIVTLDMFYPTTPNCIGLLIYSDLVFLNKSVA